jgi:hypothetical protein
LTAEQVPAWVGEIIIRIETLQDNTPSVLQKPAEAIP